MFSPFLLNCESEHHSLFCYYTPIVIHSLLVATMEAGFPMLNCLLQHTLKSLCSSSDSSKWVYAVFWRILPRNYPPPKWEYGGGALDRSKGNKRNWILVWEDGFCDLLECQRAGSGYIRGRFGADVFFKMAHEVYSYGEGLVGKVAADNTHKWVFSEPPNGSDPNFISSWNMSIEPPPRAWELQFNSGIQTIAVISVREGIIQLGSFDKIVEDLNLVISIQRKFSYLQSIPGVYAIQRPYLPLQHPYTLKPGSTHITHTSHEMNLSADDKSQVTGTKRFFDQRPEEAPLKSINMGWNSPQNGLPWSTPTMSCSLGALLSKLPSVIPSYNILEAPAFESLLNTNMDDTSYCYRVKVSDDHIATVKVEPSSQPDTDKEDKPMPTSVNPNFGFEDREMVELGFGPSKERDCCLNLN